MVPTPHTRHMRVVGFERGRNGRDLKRPIVEPMAPDEVMMGQWVRRRRGMWRNETAHEERREFADVKGGDMVRLREMRAEEVEDDVPRGRELLYCINRLCNGTRSAKRVKGPDGQGTLCGGCYFHYFSCKWLLFKRDGKDEYSIVPKDGWRLVKVLGYEQEVAGGRRDLMRPIVEKLTEGGGMGWGVTGEGVVWAKCLRCGERGAGWMGPDGGGTLCEGCWGVYAGGGMVLWRGGEDGKLSVVEAGDGEKDIVVGWRKDGQNVDYRNPVVVGYKGEVEVGGVGEKEQKEQGEQGREEREQKKVDWPKLELVEAVNESKMDDVGENVVGVVDEGKAEPTDEDNVEVIGAEKVKEGEEEEMLVEEIALEDVRKDRNENSSEADAEVEEELVEEGNEKVEVTGGIYVKVEHGGELRRSRIGVGLSHRRFRREIRKIGGVNGMFSVAYRDDEGDFVTVGTERDLIEMYHLVRRFKMEPLFLRVKLLPQS